MDARSAADFPWMDAAGRKQWFQSAQEALAEVSPEAPTEEGQFADPALRDHVRKVKALAKAEAEARRRKAVE